MRTWEIEDENGKRRVTLAEFRAELARRRATVMPVVEAMRRRDHDAVAAAQAALRKR